MQPIIQAQNPFSQKQGTNLHLLLELVQELALGGRAGAHRRALRAHDGARQVLDALLQLHLRAATKRKEKLPKYEGFKHSKRITKSMQKDQCTGKFVFM